MLADTTDLSFIGDMATPIAPNGHIMQKNTEGAAQVESTPPRLSHRRLTSGSVQTIKSILLRWVKFPYPLRKNGFDKQQAQLAG